MLIFWSLVRNSVVLAVYLLFSVACFLTVHEHYVLSCLLPFLAHISFLSDYFATLVSLFIIRHKCRIVKPSNIKRPKR